MEMLGRRIRNERKALGLALDKLAEVVGASKATLQRIETGAKSPSVALLAEISHVLRKPIDTFVKDEEKVFYKLNGKKAKRIASRDFSMVTICPFGLIGSNIVVNYFKAKAGTFIKRHQNQGYKWIFILRGSGIMEHDGVSYPVKKGDAIYYDAKRAHSVRILKSLESIDVFIRA